MSYANLRWSFPILKSCSMKFIFFCVLMTNNVKTITMSFIFKSCCSNVNQNVVNWHNFMLITNIICIRMSHASLDLNQVPWNIYMRKNVEENNTKFKVIFSKRLKHDFSSWYSRYRVNPKFPVSLYFHIFGCRFFSG